MTRATFGVSASCFAANMAVKQNAIELAHKYPLAAEAVLKSFYVDDGLAGAKDIKSAITLQRQLQDLFTHGGFMLRKWNSSEPLVLQAVFPDFRESREVHPISDSSGYTSTLGVNWNTVNDTFHISISGSPPSDTVTKRTLASDIAKVFDVLGWFAPTTVTMKILLQRVWELGIDWDDAVPDNIREVWLKWRLELPSLSAKGIPRCYSPKGCNIVSTQLHGFCDASEDAYGGVVYLRLTDSKGGVHTSLVMSKTKVSPIKRLTIPRLELCGAEVLARLLHSVKETLHIPLSDIHAWTDSTIVLSWLRGNPRRFKTYVGNRVSEIVDKIPPERWKHVVSGDNPADCASRGIFPSELLQHHLWWTGPHWLVLEQSQWPKQDNPSIELPTEEEREVCLVSVSLSGQPVVSFERYSSLTRIQRVVAWILRFVNNCRPYKKVTSETPGLTVSELATAETYLVRFSQEAQFTEEITLLEAGKDLPSGSNLLSLHPFIDSNGVLRVGGREQNSQLSYVQMHPMILHGKHPLTRLVVRSEHQRLLHAGPMLVSSAVARRFHILGMRKTVRSVTRQCVTCRRQSVKPTPQKMGQLPTERVTPGAVFEKVGVDYAGPLQVKYGMVRKPVVVKAYICIFVSLSVKAVHLEVVSDLTSAAFIAALRRFIARRGYPTLIWSDNGTNFVGANNELKELYDFLSQQKAMTAISEFCTSHRTEWRFIPERAPHFGGLWEAAVRSTKKHLRRVVGDVRLTFEELTTVLSQIEACLNSRPLVPIYLPDDDGVETLTPGHFLIGHPICALPDPASSFRPVTMLRRWDLCQNLVRHFWKRWSSEYLTSMNKFTKWHYPTRNLRVGDVVLLQDDGMIPTKWPLARVAEVHSGKDGMVRVATVRTAKGSYKRPVNKLALLLASD
jgi:transposase InsO family protein